MSLGAQGSRTARMNSAHLEITSSELRHAKTRERRVQESHTSRETYVDCEEMLRYAVGPQRALDAVDRNVPNFRRKLAVLQFSDRGGEEEQEDRQCASVLTSMYCPMLYHSAMKEFSGGSGQVPFGPKRLVAHARQKFGRNPSERDRPTHLATCLSRSGPSS